MLVSTLTMARAYDGASSLTLEVGGRVGGSGPRAGPPASELMPPPAPGEQLLAHRSAGSVVDVRRPDDRGALLPASAREPRPESDQERHARHRDVAPAHA